MRSWRALFSLLLVCIICSASCGSALAAGSSSDGPSLIDDWDIDPWGELEEIQEDQETEQPSGAGEGEAQEADPSPVISAPAGVQPFSLSPDDVTSIVITGSGTWRVGSGSLEFSSTSWTRTVDSESMGAPGYVSVTSGTLNSNYATVGCGVSGPGYVDIDFSLVAPDSLSGISGTVDLRYYGSTGWGSPGGWNASSPTLYPLTTEEYRPQLLINGTVAATCDVVDKQVVIDYDITEEVTSMVLRVYFSGTATTSSSSSTSRSSGLYYDFTGLTLDINTGEVDQDFLGGLFDVLFGWIADIWSAIINLPGQIASAIGDLLYSLFVPTEEEFTAIQEDYETLLSERLGFVWQCGTWITDFGSAVLEGIQSGDEYQFTFPGLSFPAGGEMHELVPESTVSLDNDLMAVLRPVLGTIVSLLCVAWFINMAENMVVAIVSGASYFEYLKGGGGSSDH